MCRSCSGSPGLVSGMNLVFEEPGIVMCACKLNTSELETDSLA